MRKITNSELAEKILNKDRAEKDRSGFSMGQSWSSGGSYIPAPRAIHGAWQTDKYMEESIKNLIWTTISNNPSREKDWFEDWIDSEKYKKLKMLFEPARKAMEKISLEVADQLGREIVSENIDLLPEGVISDLKRLYSRRMILRGDK